MFTYRQRLPYFVINVLFMFSFMTLFIPPAQAAAVYETGRVLQTVKHSDGVWYLMQHRVRDASQTFTVNRAVKVSKASVGAVAKARMFTPAGLAFQAALIGLDYFIDNDNEEVLPTDPDLWVPTFPAGQVRITFVGSWSGGSGCTGGGTGQNVHDSMGHALQHIIDNCDGVGASENPSYIFNPNTQCYLSENRMVWRDTCGNPSTSRFQIDRVDGDTFEPWETTEIDQAVVDQQIAETENAGPTALTDEEIADAIFQHEEYEPLLENLAYDDQFDQLNSDIAEIAAMIADLLNDVDDYQAMNPPDAPISDEDTDIQTIREIDPASDAGMPSADERPSPAELEDIVNESQSSETVTAQICEDNPDILACIDAGGTGTAEDVTFDIIDPETVFDDLYDLTGSGTPSACPAPSEFTMPEFWGGETIVLDNTMICDAFENVARPILLLAAYMAAAFILIGRSKA